MVHLDASRPPFPQLKVLLLDPKFSVKGLPIHTTGDANVDTVRQIWDKLLYIRAGFKVLAESKFEEGKNILLAGLPHGTCNIVTAQSINNGHVKVQ